MGGNLAINLNKMTQKLTTILNFVDSSILLLYERPIIMSGNILFLSATIF